MLFRYFFITLSVLLVLVSWSYVDAQKKIVKTGDYDQSIIIPSMKYVSAADRKVWEGYINGRQVSRYKSSDSDRVSDVIVVIEDELPKYFKRIEYLDKDYDGNLDIVSMRVYERAKGWRDVGITGDNKYGLKFADAKFKELIKQINRQGQVN